MRRMLKRAALALVLALLALGVYAGLNRDEKQPAASSSASLGLMLLEKGNDVYVLAVTQGSPADRAGVQPGDYLIASGDDALGGLDSLEELLVHGEESIPLTLRRDGQECRILLPVR